MLARTNSQDGEGIKQGMPETRANRDSRSNQHPLTKSSCYGSCWLQSRKFPDLCRGQTLGDYARRIVRMFEDWILRDVLYWYLFTNVGERSIDPCEVRHSHPVYCSALTEGWS